MQLLEVNAVPVHVVIEGDGCLDIRTGNFVPNQLRRRVVEPDVELGKCSSRDLLHLFLAPLPLSQLGIPDSSMVGDGGGRSQPADTTIAGGVHTAVSLSGALPNSALADLPQAGRRACTAPLVVARRLRHERRAEAIAEILTRREWVVISETPHAPGRKIEYQVVSYAGTLLPGTRPPT